MGRQGERGGDKHQCVRETSISLSRMRPDGDGTHNTDMCPDQESNWRPFALQHNAQPNEPCWPGLLSSFFLMIPFEILSDLVLITNLVSPLRRGELFSWL